MHANLVSWLERASFGLMTSIVLVAACAEPAEIPDTVGSGGVAGVGVGGTVYVSSSASTGSTQSASTVAATGTGGSPASTGTGTGGSGGAGGSGGTPTPGEIACGATNCQVALGEVCCVVFDPDPPFCTQPDGCPPDAVGAQACDGDEDCGAQLCCGFVTDNGGFSQCAAPCLFGTVTVCHSSAFCPSGHQCCKYPGFPFRFCLSNPPPGDCN
jgi:hypothetical protein